MDKIGWKRYMEGMILSEALVIQAECVDLGGCSLSLDNWAKGLACVHKQLAEQTFDKLGLMSSDHFQEVAWRQMYDALHEVPRMFQVWACKQVTNIAGVNSNQAVYKENHDPM